MAKKYQRRFASGEEAGARGLNDRRKYAAAAVFFLVMFLNIAGFYPDAGSDIRLYLPMYILFFVYVYLTERRTRKADKNFQIKTAYLVFIVYLTAANITGGPESELKWAPFFVVFVLMRRKFYKHSLFMLGMVFLSFLKHQNAFQPPEYALFGGLAALGFVLYATRRENKGIRQKIIAEGIDSGKDSGDFDVTAYKLLKNQLRMFREFSGAKTVLFFLKKHGDEKAFELIMAVSEEEESINEDYGFSLNEGVIGSGIEKGGCFAFDVKGIKLPYYKKESESASAVTVPVVLDKTIGAIAADFKEEGVFDSGEMKKRFEVIARETAGIMELFEINQKTAVREQRVSKLFDIYEKLNLLGGREKLIKTFFEEIKSFDIIGGYIAELHSGGRTLEITESFNYPGNIKGARFDVRTDEILRYVFDSGKSSVIENAKEKNIRINLKRDDVDSFYVGLLGDTHTVSGIVKLDKAKGFGFSVLEIKTLEMILTRVAMLLENAKLYDKIHRQATRDGLTGLTNHLTFQEKLRGEMEKKDRGEIPFVSLFLTDIDHFKNFNDTFGHQEGDRVLIKTSEMFKAFSGKYENTFAARYGGEEFVFVLPGYDIYKSRKIAEEIRIYCAENLTGGDGKEQRAITMSIGVSAYPDYARDSRELIKNADDYLYLAKKEGRNCVRGPK
ncbi:MAG: diguanylate cyclase [Candidatus Goldiibacteriota bacterium]